MTNSAQWREGGGVAISEGRHPLERALAPARAAVQAAPEGIMSWSQRQLDSHAERLFGPLRRRHPILSTPKFVVVTRREDVLAILGDGENFRTPYGERLSGRSILASEGSSHSIDHAQLSAVMTTTDLPMLETLVAREAAGRISGLGNTGALDVRADLVQPVLEVVVSRYLGTPGPEPGVQDGWARDIFQDIFLNPANLSSVRKRAEHAKTEMRAHVGALVAKARATAPGSQHTSNVLERFVARQADGVAIPLTDADIRDFLITLAIGWLWHAEKAALLAVDELLNRPAALVRAREAASRADIDAVRRVIWEALRFRAVQAGLLRKCTRPVTIADGTGRARRIRSGAIVFVGTHSAMWDEDAVPDPASFDPSRANAQYLIFGDGLHRCFGEHVARVQIPALLAPLLRRPGLRRAPGRAGRLRWNGNFPSRLRVSYPPSKG
jgi:cytochrome P450